MDVAKTNDKADITLVCFFATPTMLTKVAHIELLTVCAIYCDQLLDTYLRELINDNAELVTPLPAEYQTCVLQALPCYTL